MSKLGNKTKNIFQEVEKRGEADRPKRVGRPKIHTEETIKTLLTLRKPQLFWLDRLAIEIREKSDVVLDRGFVVRALLDALRESKIDISNMTSEKETKTLILAKLRK